MRLTRSPTEERFFLQLMQRRDGTRAFIAELRAKLPFERRLLRLEQLIETGRDTGDLFRSETAREARRNKCVLRQRPEFVRNRSRDLRQGGRGVQLRRHPITDLSVIERVGDVEDVVHPNGQFFLVAGVVGEVRTERKPSNERRTRRDLPNVKRIPTDIGEQLFVF